MLIGIDMIGVQSPESGDRLAGRFARHLAAALLERDPGNRYILYLHEGMATDRVPSRIDVPRVVLAPVAGSRGPARRRLAVQRLIDRNPDGLDWLILLDPFEDHLGGPPPEAPVSGVKVASVVVNFSTSAVSERDLRIIGRHDLVLAVSEPVAAVGRARLGDATARVRAIEPATTPVRRTELDPEPMTIVDAQEFGGLGLRGPFLLADASAGLGKDGLYGLIDAYADLPHEVRTGHQLVVIGKVDDPDPARNRLNARGCGEGLLLAGPTSHATIDTLLDRCSAYLSPMVERDAPQALVEAMGRGAVILGDAGLPVEPTDPTAMACQLANLLADPSLARDLRCRALRRAADFPWDTTIDSFLAALGEVPRTEMTGRRADPGHAPRPRIAYFPSVPAEASPRHDLGASFPDGLGDGRERRPLPRCGRPGPGRWPAHRFRRL